MDSDKRVLYLDKINDLISSNISDDTLFLYFLNDKDLIKHINQSDSNGWKILNFSIYHFFYYYYSFHVNKDIIYSKLITLIEFLLINGANPNLTNKENNTGLNAIQFALICIHDIRVMEIILNMLVKYGAYIKVSDMEHILENKKDVQKFVIEKYFI